MPVSRSLQQKHDPGMKNLSAEAQTAIEKIGQCLITNYIAQQWYINLKRCTVTWMLRSKVVAFIYWLTIILLRLYGERTHSDSSSIRVCFSEISCLSSASCFWCCSRCDSICFSRASFIWPVASILSFSFSRSSIWVRYSCSASWNQQIPGTVKTKKEPVMDDIKSVSATLHTSKAKSLIIP